MTMTRKTKYKVGPLEACDRLLQGIQRPHAYMYLCAMYTKFQTVKEKSSIKIAQN